MIEREKERERVKRIQNLATKTLKGGESFYLLVMILAIIGQQEKRGGPRKKWRCSHPRTQNG